MKVIGYLNGMQSLILDKPNLCHLIEENKWEASFGEANPSICEGNNVPVVFASKKDVDMWLNKLCDFDERVYSIDFSNTEISHPYEVYKDYKRDKKKNSLGFSKVKTPAFILTDGKEVGFIVTWGYTYPRFKGRIQKEKEKEVLMLIKAMKKEKKKTMTPDEFFESMNAVVNKHNHDFEAAHADADEIICNLLKQLGYEKGVEVFNNMTKQYS